MGNGGHDHVGVHGMLVVGEETVYLSHLPMFSHPQHHFQVILEGTLSGGPGDAHAAYLADRRQSEETLYTFSPNEFDLTELAPGHPSKRRSFDGTLVRGHFERGGTEILHDVTITVERVLYFQRLPVDAPPLDRLEYLLFGREPDLFLAHVITRPPDFDQVLSVRLPGDGIGANELGQGVRVAVPGRPNAIPQRLEGGERVSVEVVGQGSSRQLDVEAVAEVYFEEGELRK